MWWIIGISVLVFIIIISNVISHKEKASKYKSWLLDLNQWEINDEVEIGENKNYPYKFNTWYYNVDRNQEFSHLVYYNTAVERYEKRFPNRNKQAIVKLIKWDENDALIEFADGEQTYMSTKFISKNISYIKRKLDKNIDTFVLTKAEKIKKLRKDKLIRVLKEK